MGANYGKGLYKQLEEQTHENERLNREVADLKTANKELTTKLEKMVELFDSTVTKMQNEIERLKAQINKDSGNSSKPPSQDGFKHISNSREASGRKSGGQLGHPGKRLELPKNLEEMVEKGHARMQLKDHTGGSAKYVKRYTMDIEVILVVTEHRYCVGSAPHGAEVTYGESIKSLTALLSFEGVVAEGRISRLFFELTHGVVKLSGATIEKFLEEVNDKLDGEIETITTMLLNRPVLHVDESPVRCTSKPDYSTGAPVLRESKGTSLNAYIRAYTNPSATLYTASPKKDDEGVKRDGILPRYIGIVSQDHEAKFYNYGTAHATCGAHLLRELRGLFELQKIPWADDMRRFVSKMNDHKKTDLENGVTSCDVSILKRLSSEYDSLLAEGRCALAKLKNKELGRVELNRMLNRLTEYKDCYLLFIRDYAAPFTNNQAERDLRPCKTKQKVSGCFRSWAGVTRYAKISSFISSVKKCQGNLLIAITSVLLGVPVFQGG